jgi:hypothetical protein
MKKWFIGLLLVGICLMGKAQSFDEWFRQNSTRLKYYEEQVVALQTYIGLAEKGYNIVESGLNSIRDLKNGEFNLHNAFYTALGSINPAIGNMGEVLEILALQAAILERFTTALSRYRQSGNFRGGELDYIGKVYSLMVQDGLADVNMLTDILTANTMKMSDDERMGRIGALDVSVKDRYAFAVSFTNQADMLSMNRQKQALDAGVVKGLYGLP